MRRVALPLVPTTANGRITQKLREKEDTLSLKMRSKTSYAILLLSPTFALVLSGEDDVFSSKLQVCPSFFDFFNPLYTWLNVSHVFHFGAMCPHENLKLLVFGPLPHGSLLFLPLGIHLICHVSSDTPRLEKREIPTVSEFDEIRRGS